MLSAIIGGLFGGLIFSLLRNWAWRQYTKPQLVIGESAATSFATDDSNEITSRVFRVLVQNQGRSAAKNCKPELRMIGHLDNEEYVINTQLHWCEDQNPCRITINSGERAKCNIIRVKTTEIDEYIVVDPTFVVQFAGPDGWNEDIIKWTYDDNSGRATDATMTDTIERNIFQRIDWTTSKVIITAGNTEKSNSEINLDLGTERGMVGMEVLFSDGKDIKSSL